MNATENWVLTSNKCISKCLLQINLFMVWPDCNIEHIPYLLPVAAKRLRTRHDNEYRIILSRVCIFSRKLVCPDLSDTSEVARGRRTVKVWRSRANNSWKYAETVISHDILCLVFSLIIAFINSMSTYAVRWLYVKNSSTTTSTITATTVRGGGTISKVRRHADLSDPYPVPHLFHRIWYYYYFCALPVICNVNSFRTTDSTCLLPIESGRRHNTVAACCAWLSDTRDIKNERRVDRCDF